MSARPVRLRRRLLLGAAAAILTALALAWGVMLMLFDLQIQRRVQAELQTMAIPLLAELHLAQDGTPVVDNGPYDPRFELPGSGLYWQLSLDDKQTRSRSLWDEGLPRPGAELSNRWDLRLANGPFDQRVLIAERHVWIEGATHPPILVQMAMDQAHLRSARQEFGLEMALFMGLLWLLLSAAAWFQVRLGLKPLDAVGQDLARMQRDPQARMGQDHPEEIAALTAAIDELAQRRARDLDRARRSAADLAHSLKTPVAALRAVARQVREDGHSAQATALDELIDATSTAVEAELARARVSAAGQDRGNVQCEPLEIAERVVAVVSRSPVGAEIVFDVDIDPGQTLAVARDDLVEILGALVENAARYARHTVRISLIQAPDSRILTVEDDGKGLDNVASAALVRGARLDQTGPGHQGLGLSIVRELTEATGGRISLSHASLGGLRVNLVWPVQG